MAPQGTIIEESHEDNLASLKWQEIAENSDNFVTFESIIEELQVDPANEEDKLPAQLLEVANNILYISLGIKVKYTNSSLLAYSYNQLYFNFSR